MALTRNTAGLLASDNFASLSGWTVPSEWAVDTTRPLYVAYTSDVTLLAGGSIGSADGSGPREGHLMVVSDSLWYLFYGAGDGTTSGSGAPWRPQLAKSTDRGLSWTKLGSIPGITNGSYAARDMGGFVWKESGTYYLHALNADAVVNNSIPNVPYRNAIYSASSVEGSWTFVRETPALGASGSFDEEQVPVSWTEKIGSTYHHYWSARTASTSSDPGWAVGHGTSSTPDGVITKDGSGSFISSAVTGTNKTRPENPKKWYSSALGKHVIASNNVNSASEYTDGNTCYYSDSQTDFQTSVYRNTVQSIIWSGYDGSNAVGLISPFVTEAGAAVDDGGYVPFTWDADPPSTFNGGSNSPGYHLGRKIRQGVLEPAATCARMTASATAKLAVKPLSNSDFIAELAVEYESSATAHSFGFAYRMSANSGDTYNGYLILWDHSSNTWYWFKNTAGSYSVLSSTGGSPLRDGDNNNIAVQRWKIVVSGSSHAFYLDGSSSPILSVTDSTYSSGSYIALRGECANRVRLLSLRTSDTVTVTGLTSGDSVVLRGHGGIVAATATANGSGIATLTNKHFPLKAVTINGTDHVPADAGLIWGGDSFSVGVAYSDSVSESVSSSDSSNVLATFTSSTAENVTAVEATSFVWITSSSLTESVTVAEVTGGTYATGGTAQESLSALDSSDGAAAKTAASAESTTCLDSPTVTMLGAVTVSEAVFSVDNPSAVNTAAATGVEGVTASDSSDWSSSSSANAAEVVVVTDAQSTLAAFVASVGEALASASSESAAFAASAAVLEAANLLDVSDFSGSTSVSAGESVNASDSASALRLISGGVVEAASLDDAWSAIAAVYAQAGDALTVLDTKTATALLGAAVIELTHLADSHYGFTVWTVARGGVFVRQALEAMTVRQEPQDMVVRQPNATLMVRDN